MGGSGMRLAGVMGEGIGVAINEIETMEREAKPTGDGPELKTT